MAILSFILSKAGMMTLAGVVLLSAGVYIKSVVDARTLMISDQKASISILENNQSKLEATIGDLQQTSKAQLEISTKYNLAIAALSAENNSLSKDLVSARFKTDRRDFERLKNSRHSELVLKIINKSISKQVLDWNRGT